MIYELSFLDTVCSKQNWTLRLRRLHLSPVPHFKLLIHQSFKILSNYNESSKFEFTYIYVNKNNFFGSHIVKSHYFI